MSNNWYKELKASETQNNGVFGGRGTKISIALFIVGILLCAGLYGAVGTRTITDTSDTILSTIITSAGGTYPAVVANIQPAIDNAGQNGTVTLPKGLYISTKIIYINYTSFTLIGAGSGHWGDNGSTIIRGDFDGTMLNISNGGNKNGVTIKGIKFIRTSRTAFRGDAIVASYSNNLCTITC